MKKSRISILMAGTLVLGIILGGLGIASAASNQAHDSSAATRATAVGTSSPIQTLSDLTGLSVREIATLRAHGQTLAVIATANGVDPTTVVDRTMAARRTFLDSRMTSGHMTAAQEQSALNDIRARMQAMMIASPGRGFGSMMSRTTTTTMGYGSRPVDPRATSGQPTPQPRSGMRGPVGTPDPTVSRTGMMGPRTTGGMGGSGMRPGGR